MDTARVHLAVRGRVQGVGYRYFARRAAQALGLSGWVRNCDDGSVEAEAQGPAEHLTRFTDMLRQGPSGGHVSSLESYRMPACNSEKGFGIRF